ncbi:MAG: acyl-CoA dehydrogenase family protein [Proteobacteria bacterium]|nr:acyl-CoA dehydrogenase family protein [Pseudomonadota bacterium]
MKNLSPKKLLALAEKMADFAGKQVAPRAEDLASQAGFPHDLWDLLGREGLLGVGLPELFGGTGGGYPAIAACGEALAREGGCLGLAASWMIQCVAARFLVAGLGSLALKRRWLPELARGRVILSLAASEPGTGAHPAKMRTMARPDGKGWLLSGEKAFLTNGPVAHLFAVVAVSGGEGKNKKFTCFLVPADAPGLEKTAPMDVAALRPSPHGGIRLESVRVEKSQVLGTPGQAYLQVVKPFRDVEDACMTALFAGSLARELELAREASGGEWDDARALAAGRALALSRGLFAISLAAGEQLEQDTAHPGAAALSVAMRETGALAQDLAEQAAGPAALAGETPLARLAAALRFGMGIAARATEKKALILGRSL